MSLGTTRRNALADWYATATGVPCFWANQNMPRPQKPFGLLQVTTEDDPQGVLGAPADELRLDAAAPGVQAYLSHRRHVVSLQVFSVDTVGDAAARELLSQALQNLNTEATKAAFTAAGMSVQGVSAIRDLTQLLPTTPEGRAQADLELTTLDKTTETVGWIEQVDWTLRVPPVADMNETTGG